jgi:hypothetical protein
MKNSPSFPLTSHFLTDFSLRKATPNRRIKAKIEMHEVKAKRKNDLQLFLNR